MSGGRSKSVRERLAQSIRRTPKGPVELSYGDIVLLGDAKVGKTAIAARFVNNYFSEKYIPSSSQQKYEVDALIQCEKEEEAEKKTMVFKKSFKKSVMGNSRPLKPKQQTMKRVLTVNKSNGADTGSAYQEGKSKGLKQLKFNLIDTPSDMPTMEPITYEATIANAKGFLLVVSFDIAESLDYIKDRVEDIKNLRNMDTTPVILIANKYDLENKTWQESEVNELAARLKVKYCVSSVATKEGCEDMTALMLSEINVFATEEAYLNSLPEEAYNYCEEQEEDAIDAY